MYDRKSRIAKRRSLFTKLLTISSMAVVMGAILPACLMPPATVVQSERARTAAAEARPAKNIGDVPAPSKPTGVLISDGTVPTVMNLNPGGGWFVFNDRTPGGVMTPATTGDFASALQQGAVHTTGKGFTDWGGGIGFNFQG